MDERLDPAALGRVLGVWAHPDDESFVAAGLIARITDRGGLVSCVTATRGERGTPDPTTWPPARLGRRRTDELRAALAVLGVTDHRQLGYTDGTLAEIPDAEGTAHITNALDDVRPDTVITFGPDGYTGHPDHAAVSRWTTLACERWQPAVRMLHVTSTGDFAHRWTDLHRRTNAFPPGLPIPTPPERVAIELRLDRAELDRKLVALTAHSSQVVPLLTLLGEDTVRQWVSSETFTLPRVRSMA